MFQRFMKIFVAPRAATGDNRDADCGRDPCDQIEIVPAHHAVAFDGVQQDLAGSEVLDLAREHDGIAAEIYALTGIPRDKFALRNVDGNHDRLLAKFFSSGSDQILIFECCRVDGNFVGAVRQRQAEMFESADAAANSEWAEAIARKVADELKIRLAVVGSRANVDNDKFIDLTPGVNLDGTYH